MAVKPVHTMYPSESLRLGILGLSEGNGHPYSWSAIFNGYNPIEMERCGFPVIPRYLERQKFPDAQIQTAKVTHIWTQDAAVSAQVARAANIPHCVENFVDLVGQVDAVLLARDDAQHHFEMAEPFLRAGLPIYMDKPIALCRRDLDRLYALECYPGQIFTCSALKYAQELRLSKSDRTQVGDIQFVDAIVPKDWQRYAIHIIEPVLNIVGNQCPILWSQVFHYTADIQGLLVEWESGVKGRFTTTGNSLQCPITIRVMGTLGWHELTFSDTFSAFRAALQDFVDGIRNQDIRSDPDFVRHSVELVERGSALWNPEWFC